MENMQPKFVDVACGKEHFIALTNEGKVYSWGSGRSVKLINPSFYLKMSHYPFICCSLLSRGQLGHGSIESNEYPQEIEVLGGINIVQIACGGWHSCALSESGDVYIWGWNESGQLGLPCRNLSDSAGKR